MLYEVITQVLGPAELQALVREEFRKDHYSTVQSKVLGELLRITSYNVCYTKLLRVLYGLFYTL